MTDKDSCDKKMIDLERCDKSIAHEDSDKLMTNNKNRYAKPLTREEHLQGCLALLFFVAIIGYSMYIVGKAMTPHLSIQQLHVRGDFSNSSNPNTSIVTDIKFKSPQLSDQLNITLYYASSNQSYSPIGYSIVPGFSDGMSTKHREAVVVPSGPSWDEAQQKLGQGSTVELRVEMTTAYIYREKCRHCIDVVEREKCHCNDCGDVKPVKVVGGFLVGGSVEVERIT